nr:hypothetical protein [Psychrobacter sp. PraFG1]UNK06245.1 hypothetical protein MN210_06625 [Psychrobacter sp. PraFG1]
MAFIRTLEAEFGTEAQKIMMDMQPGDVASTYADSSSLTQLTGFTPIQSWLRVSNTSLIGIVVILKNNLFIPHI